MIKKIFNGCLSFILLMIVIIVLFLSGISYKIYSYITDTSLQRKLVTIHASYSNMCPISEPVRLDIHNGSGKTIRKITTVAYAYKESNIINLWSGPNPVYDNFIAPTQRASMCVSPAYYDISSKKESKKWEGLNYQIQAWNIYFE